MLAVLASLGVADARPAIPRARSRRTASERALVEPVVVVDGRATRRATVCVTVRAARTHRSSASSCSSTARRSSGARRCARTGRPGAVDAFEPTTRPRRRSCRSRSSWPGSHAGYHALVVSSGARTSSAHVLARPAERRARPLRRRLAGRRHRRAAVHAAQRRAAGAAATSRDLDDARRRSRRRTASRSSRRSRCSPASVRRALRAEPVPARSVASSGTSAGSTSTPVARSSTVALGDAPRRRGARADCGPPPLASHPYVDGAASLAPSARVLAVLADERSGPPARSERSALDALPRRSARVDGLRALPRRRRAARPGLARWPAPPSRRRRRAGDVDAAVGRLPLPTSQWLADEQLRAWPSGCEQRGPGALARPAARRAPGGYDVWRHRDQFVRGRLRRRATRPVLPAGPVLGLPAAERRAARARRPRAVPRGDRPPPQRRGHAAHRPRARHAAAVLGPRRGRGRRRRVRAQSPLEELLAVVAIEAQRHRATIVGEDLGTVDAAVRRAMQRDGIRRTFGRSSCSVGPQRGRAVVAAARWRRRVVLDP